MDVSYRVYTESQPKQTSWLITNVQVAGTTVSAIMPGDALKSLSQHYLLLLCMEERNEDEKRGKERRGPSQEAVPSRQS